MNKIELKGFDKLLFEHGRMHVNRSNAGMGCIFFAIITIIQFSWLKIFAGIMFGIIYLIGNYLIEKNEAVIQKQFLLEKDFAIKAKSLIEKMQTVQTDVEK